MAFLTVVICAAGVQPALAKIQKIDSYAASQMLEFTSTGHVLGFNASCMYVAAGSHVLRESFAGTQGAAPQADRLSAADGGVRSLTRVRYPELWPGITLVYDRPPGGIVRSTYQVAPGADPDQIALNYNIPVKLDAAGNLVFEFETGIMTACAPVAWQEIEGKHIPVAAAFYLDNSKTSVHFALGAYDRDLPLIIDPTLVWSTFMGSTGEDDGHAIAVDDSGNVYVAGASDATWGTPLNPHAGGADFDVFVAKLNSSGVLQWNTFMGSSSFDECWDMAVDAGGNLYIAGYSFATWGSPLSGFAGSTDAFAAKLNSSGAMQWSTFAGSADYDQANAICVDGSSNVYVAGNSSAAWGSPVNGHSGGEEVFAFKLNSSGAMQWHTFMGSSGDDFGQAVAVDGSGNVYVAGTSSATWGAPVSGYTGSQDAFAAKLNSSGARQWNTFMGASESDYGMAIAVDGSGNVYTAGYSSATWGTPLNGHSGGEDAFAAKLNSSGALQWNTFIGGSSSDLGNAIALDGQGNIYIAGESFATWGTPANAFAGGEDAFAARLSNSGELQWNTFMGSADFDKGMAIAVDGSANVHVGGRSESTWGTPVNGFEGYIDAFAAKLSQAAMTAPGVPLLLLNPSTE
jgi:hypothetical protein